MDATEKVTKAEMGRRLNHFFDMWKTARAAYATRHDGIPAIGGDARYKADMEAMGDYRRTHLPIHLLLQFVDYGRLEDALKRNLHDETDLTILLLEYELARQCGYKRSRRALLRKPVRC